MLRGISLIFLQGLNTKLDEFKFRVKSFDLKRFTKVYSEEEVVSAGLGPLFWFEIKFSPMIGIGVSDSILTSKH